MNKKPTNTLPPNPNPDQPFVLTRARLTGVMCGYLVHMDADSVVLREARQIWRFGGAETCSGLAEHGASLTETTRIDKPAPLVNIQREPGMAVFNCTQEAEENLRQSRWL